MAYSDVDITPELVQAVRDAIDVVSLAGEYTSLKRRGKRYVGLCPFHKEKTPSFSVDPDQGLFYCFGCGAGGDAIKLYMEQSGDDFPAAIENLAQRYGIPLPRKRRGARRRDEPDLGSALEAAAAFFTRALAKSEAAQGYLDRRQIPPALRRQYGLGYAPDAWDRLLSALGRRIPTATLEAAGLISRSEKSGKLYDRFRHRLMFPVHSPAGRLVGFGGRTLGDDRAKYINTAETAYFHKGNLLYGLHQAKRALRDGGRAVLVEGYFDVLGMAAAEIPWAVAGMGTALTAEQARLLARFADEVVVAYDADDAGEKAFERALPLLLDAGLVVRRARFPTGHDPDSLRLEAGPEAVRAAVEEAADGVWLLIRRRIP
ncbi:MAG: DNA primase, partial [Acidobacteria bacterium]